MTGDEEESQRGAGGSRLSSGTADEEGEPDDFLTRLRTAETRTLVFARELLVSVSIVVAIGLVLYLVSGVWPPMVAVESGSMEPHMERGDLIVISAPDRFSPEYDFEQTGVVTADVGEERGYRTIGGYGSVVIYDPPSRLGSPIIHRAHFWVEDGENWYDQADPDYVNADNCAELSNCPAPHAGFITKGDANAHYDQASGIAEPVRTEWIEGIARLRVPYLGYVRLKLAGLFFSVPVSDSVISGVSATSGIPAIPSDSSAVHAEPLRFVSTSEIVSPRRESARATEAPTPTAAFDGESADA